MGVISGAALTSHFPASVEQPRKVWRIGHVLTGASETGGIFAQTLEQRLADLGYVQGRNIVLLHRYAGSRPDENHEVIISLLPQIDLLVVWGEAAIAAKKLAGSVPTVFISIGFPVELGLVQSLAHPGGNMTGITSEAAVECRISNEWLSFTRSGTQHLLNRPPRTWRPASSESPLSASTSNRPMISMLPLPI